MDFVSVTEQLVSHHPELGDVYVSRQRWDAPYKYTAMGLIGPFGNWLHDHVGWTFQPSTWFALEDPS